MTLAEKYRQEGKLEGKLEALHEIALNLLSLGMSTEQVAQATKLPRQEVQDLWKQNATKH
jgi:predicted transposase/invertase (TIGR01784 family)